MSEANDPFAEALSPTEREMLGLGQTVTYRYRCSRCRHEDDVPDVVIDGFAASGGCRPGQMPQLVCPQCGGLFRAVERKRPRAAR
jgi:hypothetical protein